MKKLLILLFVLSAFTASAQNKSRGFGSDTLGRSKKHKHWGYIAKEDSVRHTPRFHKNKGWLTATITIKDSVLTEVVKIDAVHRDTVHRVTTYDVHTKSGKKYNILDACINKGP